VHLVTSEHEDQCNREASERERSKITKEEKVLTIEIYLTDNGGTVFSYEIPDDPTKAREHAAAIIARGYRHNDGEGVFIAYPPHRIEKVKVVGGKIPTGYPGKVRGT